MLRRAIPIATLSLAAAALFFALWPVVADAPWEEEKPQWDSGALIRPTPTGSVPAFNDSDVRRIVQADVAANRSWPAGAKRILCVSANYVSGNGLWVVKCQYYPCEEPNADCPDDFTSRSYVFDDATGHLVD